jgi:hypothetical protein
MLPANKIHDLTATQFGIFIRRDTGQKIAVARIVMTASAVKFK